MANEYWLDPQYIEHGSCNISINDRFSLGDTVHIVVTADSGYYYPNQTNVKIVDKRENWNDSLTPSGNFNSNRTQWYQDITITNNMYVGCCLYPVSWASELSYYTFTNDLTNATSNISPNTQYNSGDTVSITVTADSGYYFSSAPRVKYILNGVANYITLTSAESGDYKTTYSGSITISSSWNKGLTIEGSGVLIPDPYYHFDVSHLSNATTNVNSATDYDVGDTVSITVTADSGYYFSSAPRVSYTLNGYINYIDLTTSQTTTYKTEYSGSITIDSSWGKSLVVFGTGVELPPSPYYHFDLTYVSNATTNISSSTDYDVGDTVSITVTADSGYYFDDDPYISYVVLGVPQQIYLTTTQTDEHKTIYSGSVTIASNWSKTLYVHASGQVIPIEYSDLLGFVALYNPDYDVLHDLSLVRFANNVDLGNYITNMIKVFVDVPEVLTANIVLGGYDTLISCNSLNYEIVETDLGSVNVGYSHYNNLDYESTTVNIYLPLIGFKQLKAVDVVGSTIHIVYKTNLINGDTLACIFKTVNNNDILIYTFSCNGSYTVPYRLNADTKIQGSFDVESNYLYGFTAFLDVATAKPHSADNNYSGNSRSLINYSSFVTGDYVRGELLQDNLNCLESEKELIYNLFDKGVII